MRLTTVALTLFAPCVLGSVINRRDCPANDCILEVFDSDGEMSEILSHVADCSSFMVSTVTPEVR